MGKIKKCRNKEVLRYSMDPVNNKFDNNKFYIFHIYTLYFFSGTGIGLETHLKIKFSV